MVNQEIERGSDEQPEEYDIYEIERGTDEQPEEYDIYEKRVSLDEAIRLVLSKVENTIAKRGPNKGINQIYENREGRFLFRNLPDINGILTLDMRNATDEYIVGHMLLDDKVVDRHQCGSFGNIKNYIDLPFISSFKQVYLQNLKYITATRFSASQIINPVSKRIISKKGKTYKEIYQSIKLNDVVYMPLSKYKTVNYDIKTNCVYDYFKTYDKKLQQEEFYTLETVMRYANKYNFPCIARDIFYNEIDRHEADRSKTRRKKVEFIIHEGHIYILEDEFTEPKKNDRRFIDTTGKTTAEIIAEIDTYTNRQIVLSDKYDDVFCEISNKYKMADYSDSHFYYNTNKIIYVEDYQATKQILMSNGYNSDNIYNYMETDFKMKGHMNNDVLEAFEAVHNIPNKTYTNIRDKKENTIIVDINKAYQSKLYGDFEFPRPSMMDKIEKYDNQPILKYCMYYCELVKTTELLSSGWHSGYMVIELRKDKMIKQITNMFMPSGCSVSLSHEEKGKYPTDLLRKYIGWLRKTDHISTLRCEVNDDAEKEALKKLYGNELRITKTGVSIEKVHIKSNTGLLANLFICDLVLLDLYRADKQIKKLNPNIILNRVKTDSLGYLYDKKVKLPNNFLSIEWGKFKIEHQGKTHNIDSIEVSSNEPHDFKPYAITKPQINNLDESHIKRLLDSNQGFCLFGQAGTGKSYQSNNVIIPHLEATGKKYILTSSTIENAEEFAEKSGREATTINKQIHNMSKYELSKRFNGIQYLLVDEASQLTQGTLKMIDHIKNALKVSVILIGDENQCLSVDAQGQSWLKYDYLKSICDNNVITLTKIYRYDGELATICQFVNDQNNNIETIRKYVISKFNNTEKIIDKLNLCYRHITRKEVQNKDLEIECYTTHSYQGKTIQGKYTIFDINLMTREILYTALSRGTIKDNISIYIGTYGKIDTIKKTKKPVKPEFTTDDFTLDLN